MITCPKCGHVRTPQEDEFTPEWQCPACGVAYAKVTPKPPYAVEIPVEENIKKISINLFIRPAIFVAIIGLAVLGGIYGYKEYDRSQQLSDAQRVMELADRWDSARKLAANTGRIALAAPLKDLQSLTREARDIKVSGCAEKMRELLFKGMDLDIKGFLLFMGGKENENEAMEISELSRYQMAKYSDEKGVCLAAVGDK